MGEQARTRIAIPSARGSALLAAVALIAALLLALAPSGPLGTGSADAAAKAGKTCGTYSSTSYYRRAKVTRVRGISCSKAMRTAKRFDRRGAQTPPLRCGYAHGGGRRLFSCDPPNSNRPVLVAIGKGKRQG